MLALGTTGTVYIMQQVSHSPASHCPAHARSLRGVQVILINRTDWWQASPAANTSSTPPCPCRAANGHIRVLEAVIESLKVATKEIPTDDDMLGPKAVIGWGRFVKEVMNQRSVTGATPMMVACEQG